MSGNYAWRWCSCLLALAVWSGVAHALIDAQSDGSDGPFNPSTSVEIDLGLAADAAWNTPSPLAGRGVYDGSMWAVVFKYTDINIPMGVTVTFKNHPSRAPVVWLVDGNVTIQGVVNLGGADHTGNLSTLAEPGPGGFRGGRSFLANDSSSPGFGPGGGNWDNNFGCGGSYGFLGGSTNCNTAPAVGPTYGGRALPLIGGSGGSGDGDTFAAGGGAGGGAILIVANDTITLEGTIQANGGNSTSGTFPNGGGGSGGAIRLIADTIVDPLGGATGLLLAQGGSGYNAGGDGRIRVEANAEMLVDEGDPFFSMGEPCVGEGCIPDIWPPSGSPTLNVTDIAGLPAPSDPRSSFDFPGDLSIAAIAPVAVTLQASNIPVDGSWDVKVRITPKGKMGGGANPYTEVCATLQGGSLGSSTWAATVSFPADTFSALQARASIGTTCP